MPNGDLSMRTRIRSDTRSVLHGTLYLLGAGRGGQESTSDRSLLGERRAGTLSPAIRTRELTHRDLALLAHTHEYHSQILQVFARLALELYENRKRLYSCKVSISKE